MGRIIGDNRRRRALQRKFKNTGAYFRLLSGMQTSLGFTPQYMGKSIVRVARVEALGAAAHADIMEGDLIRKFDGQRIWGPKDMKIFLGELIPGDEIELEIAHYDRPDVWETIRLEVFAENSSGFSQYELRGIRDKELLTVSTRTLYTPAKALFEMKQIQRTLGLAEVVEQGRQLILRKVVPGGPAALAGIKSGDTLCAIGDYRRIRTQGQYKKKLLDLELGSILRLIVSSPNSGPVNMKTQITLDDDEKKSKRKNTEPQVQRRRANVEVLSEMVSKRHIYSLRRMAGLETPQAPKPLLPEPEEKEDQESLVTASLSEAGKDSAVYEHLGVSFGFQPEPAPFVETRPPSQASTRPSRPPSRPPSRMRPLGPGKGVLIGKTTRFGPATQAGLVEGDVILAIGSNSESLRKIKSVKHFKVLAK
jgi:S1-C subfamily serine protease